jgi:DNA polymerase
MFVGEQPGDQEDLAGRPFVGPAGQVFDAALAAAGIERGDVYVTNAVKHFKFEPRGKRRIHQKPNAGEISACRFWLDLERAFVRPQLIVAMGATAVASLVGRGGSITRLRGRPHTLEDGTALWVTVHPSYLLRMPDRAQAAIERRRFEEDLRAIREYVEALPAATETASARR